MGGARGCGGIPRTLREARVAEPVRLENGGDSLWLSTEASPQGNPGRRYLGACTAEGQGALVHPGLWPLCREADGLPGVQGQSPARRGRLLEGEWGAEPPLGRQPLYLFGLNSRYLLTYRLD